MDYITFKNKYTGQRLDVDGVYQYQCVDEIIQYVREVLGSTASMYGNAIDFWTRTPQALLDTCDKIDGTDCQQGDIIVFRTAGHTDFAGDGHVGICDHQDASNVYVLEQNCSGSATGTGIDAIGVHRGISKSRIAGILRPRVAPLYKVENITPRQVKVRAGSRKWNLAHGTFNDVAGNPITTADDNTVFTAHAVLHHREIPQYNYYLEDPNTPHGWNVLDCMDYVAPAPPPPPYVPPAAPVEVKKAETYEVVTDIVWFDNSRDALVDLNAKGLLKKGTYYVYARDRNMLNLTTNNVKDEGKWVNPAQNVLATLPPKITETIENAAKDIPVNEPVDAPSPEATIPSDAPLVVTNPNNWRVTRSLRPDGKPVLFDAYNETPMAIRDLEDKLGDIILPPYNDQKPLPIVSVFVKDGIEYGRPEKVAKQHLYFGVPMHILQERGETWRNNGKLEIEDIREWIEPISDFIDYASKRAYTQVKSIIPKSTKYMDGYRAAVKNKRNKVQ